MDDEHRRSIPEGGVLQPSNGRIDGSTRMVSPGCDAASTWSSVLNGRLRLPFPPAAASACTYHVEAASLAPTMNTKVSTTSNTYGFI